MKNKYTHVAVLLDRSGSMHSLKNDVINGFNSFLEQQKKANGKCTMTLVEFDNSPYEKQPEIKFIPTINSGWAANGTSAIPLTVTPHIQTSSGTCISKNITFGTALPSPQPLNLWNSLNDGYLVIWNNKDVQNVQPLNNETYLPRGATAYLDALGKLIEDTGVWLSSLPEDERPEKVVVVIYTDGEENSSRKYSKPQIAEKIKHQEQIYNWQFSFLGANFDAVTEGFSLGVGAANSITYTANSVGVNESWGALSSNLVNYRTGAAKNLNYTAEQRNAVTGNIED